jgi:hypothetical protein
MGTRALKGGSAGCPEPHDRAEREDLYQRLIAQEKGLLHGRKSSIED